MEWIVSNWEWIALAAGLAISVLNAVTRHFSEHKGVAKVALFLVELLSILTSAGQVNGRLGKFKPPMRSVKNAK